jgi:hypothetical protein
MEINRVDLGLYPAISIEPDIRLNTNSCDSFSDSLKLMREKIDFQNHWGEFRSVGKMICTVSINE